MTYPGGKGAAGVYQTLINLIPPHGTYVAAFCGLDAIARHKKACRRTVLIDKAREPLEAMARALVDRSDVELLQTCGVAWLRHEFGLDRLSLNNAAGSSNLPAEAPAFSDEDRNAALCDVRATLDSTTDGSDCKCDDHAGQVDESGGVSSSFVFLDPPYVLGTRSKRMIYGEHEMTDDEHRALLDVALRLPCNVMITGYESDLYEEYLDDWNRVDYMNYTRGGPRQERAWLNYEKPTVLHDARFVGADKRERERIRRRVNKWVGGLRRMGTQERQAVVDAIAGEFIEESQLVTARSPVTTQRPPVTAPGEVTAVTGPTSPLVLSLFPGIGLLDMAFEEQGFTVVRGPDALWGGDIRHFHPPAGKFDIVIGGPPCQDWSDARHNAPPTGHGLAMFREFARVVNEARPLCFLLENVRKAPNVTDVTELSHEYKFQRVDINQSWYVPVNRLRHLQFGSLGGRVTLEIDKGKPFTDCESPALASKGSEDLVKMCRLQGLPADFADKLRPPFTKEGAAIAIGNGVPLPMGRAIALAMRRAIEESRRNVTVRTVTPPASHVTTQRHNVTDQALPGESRRCKCGCGRRVTGGKLYESAACRQRAKRKRDAAAQKNSQSQC